MDLDRPARPELQFYRLCDGAVTSRTVLEGAAADMSKPTASLSTYCSVVKFRGSIVLETAMVHYDGVLARASERRPS